MKVTIDEAHDYMKTHWVLGDESWSDFAVMEEMGDTEMLSDALVSAGAIDSEHCYESAKPIEKLIEKLAKKFRKLSAEERVKRYNEVFKECVIVSCGECNAVSFLNSGNEKLYPETLKKCWECNSKKIEVKKGLN